MSDLDNYYNLEMLPMEERVELVERLNESYWDQVPIEQQEYVNEIENQRNLEQMYTAERHGLDLGKLYHNKDGGYDINTLKKVL